MSSSPSGHQPLAWYEAVDAVLDTDLATTEKLLMVALIVHAGLKPDGTAYPSLKTLARKISLGQEKRERTKLDKPRDIVRHVRRLLKSLESKKLVERNGRPGMTTEFRVRWEQLLHPGHQSPPTPDTDVTPPRTSTSAHPGHPCPPNIPMNLPHKRPPEPGSPGGFEFSGGKRKQDARIGTRLKSEHLSNNDDLDSWFRWHTKYDDRLVDESERGRLLVFGAAERAIEIGKYPIQLFAHIILQRKWDLISDAQRVRAKRRIAQLDGSRSA